MHAGVQDHPPSRHARLRPRPVRREPGILAGLGVGLRRARHQRPAAPPEPLRQILQFFACGHHPAHFTSAIMIGGAWKYVMLGDDPTVSFAISRASRSESARRYPSRATDFGSPAHEDHVAAVIAAVRAPVPHVERVHAVIGVRRAVQVDVPRVACVALLERRLDLLGVGGLGEHLFEEVDVARVMDRVELPRHRVEQDRDPALAHERLVPIHVEQVPEPEAVHQDRVQDRVHVVRPEVRAGRRSRCRPGPRPRRAAGDAGSRASARAPPRPRPR